MNVGVLAVRRRFCGMWALPFRDPDTERGALTYCACRLKRTPLELDKLINERQADS